MSDDTDTSHVLCYVIYLWDMFDMLVFLKVVLRALSILTVVGQFLGREVMASQWLVLCFLKCLIM